MKPAKGVAEDSLRVDGSRNVPYFRVEGGGNGGATSQNRITATQMEPLALIQVALDNYV